MQTLAAWETLKQFRLAAYRPLGLRQDSLFELMEAVLAAPGPATLVRLSLTAGIPQDGVVPAWEYEWPVGVPAPAGRAG